MPFWIFKIATQDVYSEQPGRTYVYDNRHSIRVAEGDSFVYLDKRRNQYAFTGHGTVHRLRNRAPNAIESPKPRVHKIYTAEIVDYVEYQEPVDIRPSSSMGKLNRSKLGVLNALAWGISMPRLEQSMYDRILDLAYDAGAIAIDPPNAGEYEVPDSWSYTKKRHVLGKFRKTVRERQDWTCLICGTKVREVIDVAHISPYASDSKNRANPANGIALCGYCHRAFDRNVIKITPDAHVVVLTDDSVAQFLGSRIQPEDRVSLMIGVDLELIGVRFRMNNY